MRITDILLLLFLAITVAFRRKYSWKRTGLYVLLGTMIGDLAGGALILILYHWFPNVIYVGRYLSLLGAIAGGICDWLSLFPKLNNIGQKTL
jgi:hypothetical protein